MPATAPVEKLEHGHVALTHRIESLLRAQDALQTEGSEQEAFIQALEDVAETLFEHFAQEEEGLFPFLAELLPEEEKRIDEMHRAHDRICGAAARLLAGMRANGPRPEVLASLLERFADAYLTHSQMEIRFLHEVNARLSADDRGRLAALLESL